MITFCPWCANVLLIRKSDDVENALSCQTCPYVYHLKHDKQVEVGEFEAKEVDDILGGEAAWENVDKTDGKCSNYKSNINRLSAILLQRIFQKKKKSLCSLTNTKQLICKTCSDVPK